MFQMQSLSSRGTEGIRSLWPREYLQEVCDKHCGHLNAMGFPTNMKGQLFLCQVLHDIFIRWVGTSLGSLQEGQSSIRVQESWL